MTDFGSLLIETELAMLTNLAEWSVRWRENAERLSVIKPAFIAEKGAKEFVEWRRNLGFTDATASKMLTVAKWVPWEREELRTIGGVKLYSLARVVRDGFDFEDAAVDAQALSASEFDAKYGLTVHRHRDEKRGKCPYCGHTDALAEFEQAEATPAGDAAPVPAMS